MAMRSSDRVRAAEVVLACAELADTLAFFTERLGFRVESIAPADAPNEVALSGYGLRVRLVRGGSGSPGHLRLHCDDPATMAGGSTELVAPNGTRVELVVADPPVVVPPLEPALCVTRLGEGSWHLGRVGMRYRDLIPDRQGGRFAASHIHIADGGPVADYVHYHAVQFQMIYCYRGWVRVVYEDQGSPFVLEAGDCALQPPRIRHRVLESSPGLEVIELSSPAAHQTVADHDLELPTASLRADRDFGGQQFLRHRADAATWEADPRFSGFEARDLGIAAATGGLAGARVLRSSDGRATPVARHRGELMFGFVLEGSLTLECGGIHRLEAGDCFVVPPGTDHALADCAAELELLEITRPGTFIRDAL